ncbi:MAG: 30S ribosomal protein S17 [Vicinamibacterales bacterium]
MAAKTQMVGVVVSDKMDQTVVVAVERQVRHALYGKSQRRTSKFLAHNEGNAARAGDVVEIYGSRPLSRRKRWVVTRIVRRALDLREAGGREDTGAEGGSR